ncbi:MAG TPA: hypothetical protein VLZ32_01050 [Rhodanobacter sp.]|nr:hypothetical protein [Rhodanobacter sp.]
MQRTKGGDWNDLDAGTLALLRQRHWRVSPRVLPWNRWLLGLVALLHVVMALVAWQALRPPRRVVQAESQQVLQVRFIARTPLETAAPPPPVVPSLPQREPPARTTPAIKRAMTIQLPATPPARKPVTLYDRDGQPLLPAASASSATPGYVSHALQGDRRIMQNSDPIKYKGTSLDKYFPPPDETLGGAALRHVVDAVVKDTDVDLPGGIHLKCKTVVGLPIPDCINPPPPPSAKDGDARLSMAPSKPLAPDPKAAKPPSVEACIAIYRANKPLPWGCPTDTPNRAVDAELRDRAAGAARAH